MKTPPSKPQALPEEEIWEELLHSEASKNFLDEQIKEAETLLKQPDN